MRIALAIHRTGSMQAAAEMLQIDRTTVLRRLDAMEKQIGSRLFDRGSEGCTLTPKGEDVVRTAESIETAMASLGRRIGSGNEAAGKVTVTVPEYFASKILAPALPRLKDLYPAIEVNVQCGNNFLNILRGEADIGLRNRWPEQTSLIAKKVAAVGHAFYASKSYLEKRGTPAGSLAGHDFILFGEGIATMAGYDRMMELASVGRIVLRSNEILPLETAACAGLGIAYLPCMVAYGHSELSAVWPGLIGRLHDVFLVAHEDVRVEQRIRAVYDFMADLCAEFGDVMSGREVADAFPSLEGQTSRPDN